MMKALIEINTITNDDEDVLQLYFLGMRLYRSTYKDNRRDKVQKPVGFIQHPSDAPTSTNDEGGFEDKTRRD